MVEKKESSAELSTLAGQILNEDPLPMDDGPFDGTAVARAYNELLAKAQRLAGSVMSQDVTPGQRGNDAHEPNVDGDD